MFVLDQQLERDTFFITDLELSRVLLMNNSLFPWLILVPRAENAVDIIDLPDIDRHLLMDEISSASIIIKNIFKPYKINVSALGNRVRQLHIHVIARSTEDSAWPDPVWGKGHEPYSTPKPLIEKLYHAFKA